MSAYIIVCYKAMSFTDHANLLLLFNSLQSVQSVR